MSFPLFSINSMRTLADTTLDADTIYELGMSLLGNKYGPENTVYAAEFLQKAAEKGHVLAMYDLGMCYRWGDGGVYAEPEEALAWFSKAAEAGNENARSLMAHFGSEQGKLTLLMSAMSGAEGQGTKWYKTKAGVEMYYQEARAGNGECQYELARQLADPRHVGPFKYDIEAAVHWYTEAGNNGVIDAMFNLAQIYLKGAGTIEADKAKARAWMEKCAQAGDAEAAGLLKNDALWT